MAIPSQDDFETGSTTQALRRIYAKRYSDYVESQIDKLWDGEMTYQEAIYFVKTIGIPELRNKHLGALFAMQRNPEFWVNLGKNKSVKVAYDPLGKDGSRRFKEVLTSDVFDDAQAALQAAGFGDLLSALAFRIGSHQRLKPESMTAESTKGLFSHYTD